MGNPELVVKSHELLKHWSGTNVALSNNLFVTCFHKFRIYNFFAKFFLFSFKIGAK